MDKATMANRVDYKDSVEVGDEAVSKRNRNTIGVRRRRFVPFASRLEHLQEDIY